MIVKDEISNLSARWFYQICIKDEHHNDWLIPILSVCLILKISESSFHRMLRKREDFPRPVKKSRNRLYWTMNEVVNYYKKGSKTK